MARNVVSECSTLVDVEQGKRCEMIAWYNVKMDRRGEGYEKKSRMAFGWSRSVKKKERALLSRSAGEGREEIQEKE